jgi:hypothetical protein
MSNRHAGCQTNAACTDLNNTFDPGGGIGQLVFRLNW